MPETTTSPKLFFCFFSGWCNLEGWNTDKVKGSCSVLILHSVMHSSKLLQGIRLLAKNQNKVTYTHRSCFCFSDLGRHPICGQQSLCLKLGMCCFLCVRRVVAMSWLVSYYHPSPTSFSPKHRHTLKHTHRLSKTRPKAKTAAPGG